MHWTQYQRAYLADRSPRKIVNKSRRIGYSEVVCFESACRALGVEMWPGSPPVAGLSPVPQNIFSASKPQAIDLLARVVRHVKLLSVAFKGGKVIADEGKEQVRLVDGTTLRAFSTNARTSRGGEGDTVLDEFANVMRQEDVWRAVKPLADRTLRNPHGYHVRVISTPLGDDNLFYQMCEGTHKHGWSYHRVDIHRAIADGFTVRNDDGSPVTAEDLRRESADPDLFDQEYGCSFMSSSSRYISREQWDNACYDDSDHEQSPQGHSLGVYGGMDVGAGGHESVIVDLERNSDGALWQIAHADRRREADWDAQERWVDSGMNRRRRLAVDATGIGAQFGQRLEHRFAGQVEAVKFTLQSKEQLATGLKLGLARKVVRPMGSDTKLMRDVLSLRRTVTGVGNVRYDAESTKVAHADGAWALALAAYAGGGSAAEPTIATRMHVPEGSGIAGPRYRRGEAFR